MPRRRHLVVLCLVGSLLLVAALPVARAGGPTDEARAARLADEGLLHFGAARYEQALEAFRAALELYRSPIVLYNIARCLQLLGRMEEALAAYAACVAEGGDARITAQAERRRGETEAALRRDHALLAVTSTPPGATVRVDGEERGRGETPLTLWLPAGRHKLRFTFAGHVPLVDTVTVAASEDARVGARLVSVATPGRLVLVGGPVGAAVTVDGKPLVGRETALPGGAHVVRATHEGFAPFEERVELRPGERQDLRLAMAPLPPATTAPEDETPTDGPRFRYAWYAWVTTGLTVAALATGVTFHVLARTRVDELDGDWGDPAAPVGPWRKKVDEADRDLRVAGVCYGVAGAAALATGVILLVENLQDGEEEPTVRVLPTAGAGELGGVLQVRW